MGKKRPPVYNKGAGAGHQHVIMPEKFLCRVCQKWKANSHYSNKELNKFIYFVARGSQLTPTTAKLRCRDCSGAPVLELSCLGPCGETKSLDAFSKSARQSGGSNWCMICTLWKESSEHNVSVQAPPSRSDPEAQTHLPSQLHDYEYSDPEAGDDGSDYDDGFPTTQSVITSHMSELSIGSSSTARHYHSERLGHVNHGRNYMSNRTQTGSASITTTDSVGEDSQSSVSNQWENASISSYNTHGRTQQSGSSNNAWGSSGRNNVSKAQEKSIEENRKSMPPSSKSGWAKPFGSRNAGRYYEAEQTSSNHQGLHVEQDSDSEDLIDL